MKLSGLCKSISVYVHWPYCASLCSYCDFNKYVSESIPHERLTQCYLKEIDHFFQKSTSNTPLQLVSIYFGGGTPSLANPKTIHRIIDAVKARCSQLSSNIEVQASKRHISRVQVTLEGNPNSLSLSKLQKLKESGVNRISE